MTKNSSLSFLPNADELIGSNPFVVLLQKWHRLEPKRIRKYTHLWVFDLGSGQTCDVLYTPESIQDKAAIQHCVQFSATALNMSCELTSTLHGTWNASFFLPTPSYCYPLGSCEHPDPSVAMLTAYLDALEVIISESVA